MTLFSIRNCSPRVARLGWFRRAVAFVFSRKAKPYLEVEDGFSLLGGRVYAVIGKSGAGKTVLNSLFMGCPAFQCCRYDQNLEGEFFSLKFTRRQLRSRLAVRSFWTKLRRRGVLLYLPQQLPDGRGFDMSTREYFVEVTKALLRECGVTRRTSEILSVFKDVEYEGISDDIAKLARPLANRLNRPLNRLSGGERRRIELIARMFALNALPRSRPCLLVLDEPTTGLDIPSVNDYLENLRKGYNVVSANNANIAIVVTTHALHLLSDSRVFDDVIIVRKKEDLSAAAHGGVHCWISRPVNGQKLYNQWVCKMQAGSSESRWAAFLQQQSEWNVSEFVRRRAEVGL